MQPIDTRSPHQRSIYSHWDISIAIFTKKRITAGLGTRWVFYPLGYTFILHWQTRGRVRSWRNSHFTTSSIIERFPRKCSPRSTVQAIPILFYHVMGRLPRYVMLKYFWICESLIPFAFLNILISHRTLCSVDAFRMKHTAFNRMTTKSSSRPTILQ